MRHSYVTPKRPAFSPRCCPVVPTCVSARHVAKYARKTRCSNLNAGRAPDDADNIFNASNRVKGRRLRSQSSHRVRLRMSTGTPKTPLLLTKWCPSQCRRAPGEACPEVSAHNFIRNRGITPRLGFCSTHSVQSPMPDRVQEGLDGPVTVTVTVTQGECSADATSCLRMPSLTPQPVLRG